MKQVCSECGGEGVVPLENHEMNNEAPYFQEKKCEYYNGKGEAKA